MKGKIMISLDTYIEINGKQRKVGKIEGNTYLDARFSYDAEYMNSEDGAPVSISLPFQKEPFSAEKTKNFFESLLPEGFSRKAVADWIKTDEYDYLAILKALGKECLGAIKIGETDDNDKKHYEKLSLEEVKALAAEGATKSTRILMETHLSLTGASGKVGLLYNEDNKEWYLPKGEAPSTHIVKQSHVRLNHIVLNEQLCMLAAKALDLTVPETFILDLGNGRDDEVLYATKRYDRLAGEGEVVDGIVSPIRLHQEDFAQAMGISAANKYEKEKKGYLKGMFEIIQNNSANPIEDKRKLLEYIVFNYLIGNTDCHVKNYSLLYDKDLKSVRLAPAYDIVATQVYNTTTEMSFFIGDEIDINNIDRSSFINCSNELGLSSVMVGKVFDKVASKFNSSLQSATESLMKLGYDEAENIQKKILKTGGCRRYV